MNIVRYGVVAVAVLSFGGWGQTAGAEKEHDAGVRTSDTAEDDHWEAMRLEREYRQRIARLHRLLELAEQEKAPDRIAELNELDDRLEADHVERLSEIRNQLDGRAARRLDEALAVGRDHEERIRERREDRRDGRRYASDHSETGREARRGHVADDRASRRNQHVDHREIRGDARERAEQRWLDARGEAGASVQTATHMNHAASRLADKRWREEASDRGAERWERAARRSGMLGDVQPERNFSVLPQREVDARIRREISAEDAEREFERLRRER